MKRANLTDRAATALDLTHHCGERGPKTFMTRQRISKALDLGKRVLVQDIKHLESVIRRERNRR